jgi:hypothetical protein
VSELTAAAGAGRKTGLIRKPNAASNMAQQPVHATAASPVITETLLYLQ